MGMNFLFHFLSSYVFLIFVMFVKYYFLNVSKLFQSRETVDCYPDTTPDKEENTPRQVSDLSTSDRENISEHKWTWGKYFTTVCQLYETRSVNFVGEGSIQPWPNVHVHNWKEICEVIMTYIFRFGFSLRLGLRFSLTFRPQKWSKHQFRICFQKVRIIQTRSYFGEIWNLN